MSERLKNSKRKEENEEQAITKLNRKSKAEDNKKVSKKPAGDRTSAERNIDKKEDKREKLRKELGKLKEETERQKQQHERRKSVAEEKETKKKRDEIEKKQKKAKEKEEMKKKEGKKAEEEKETVDQYEDDFEDYESDFEEDQEEEEIEGQGHNGLATNRQQTEEEGGKGEEEEESILMRRLASASAMPERGEAVIEGQEDRQQQGGDRLVPEERELPILDGGKGGAGHEWEWDGQRPLGDQQNGSQRTAGNSGRHLMDAYLELIGKGQGRSQAWTQTERPAQSIGSQCERADREDKGTGTRRQGRGEQEEQSKQGPIGQSGGTGEQQPGTADQRLGRFARAAEQLLLGLLTMSAGEAGAQGSLALENNCNLPISSRYSSFSLHHFFKDSQICAIAVKNPTTFGMAVYVPHSDDAKQHKKSFAAEFSIFDRGTSSAKTERLLCCDQEVAALRYSPVGSPVPVLFAGLRDGSLVAWDLHGRADSLDGAKLTAPVLFPCADTALDTLTEPAKSAKGGRGTSAGQPMGEFPIVALELLSGARTGAIAQLAVLHEAGLVRLWTALDCADTDALNSEARVKLVFTSAIRLLPGMSGSRGLISEWATCLGLHADGTAAGMHILVGSSRGRLLAANKFTERQRPMEYSTGEAGGCDAIVCLRVCPSAPILAAMTTSQRIMVYKLGESEPFCVLRSPMTTGGGFSTSAGQGLSLEWSPNEPNVLYSIHSGGEHIVTWRLDNSAGAKPVGICNFYSEFRARIQHSLGWADGGRSAFLGFALSNGELHVHCLERAPTNAVRMMNGH